MANPLLQLDGVTKRFGRVVIAEDLSFEVGPGDTVGIVGPNGAGKTSLFGLISGDLTPGAGNISFAGRPVTKLDAAARGQLRGGRRSPRAGRHDRRGQPARRPARPAAAQAAGTVPGPRVAAPPA